MSDTVHVNPPPEKEDQKTDERLKDMSSWRKALIRPELGSMCGVILVFVIFFLIARDSGMFSSDGVMNWLVVSSQFAILAVGACLLMIAGEFDLSIGSMIGFAGIIIAVTSVHYHWPVSLSILFTFACTMSLGFLNGYIVIRTGLPSFIVSLAFLYMLRGLTIWSAILFTRRTIISGVTEVAQDSLLAPLFGGVAFKGLFRWMAEAGLIGKFTDGTPVVQGIPALILWAILLIVVAQLVLTRTHYGNWIFASGGDAQAALYVGVPVQRVKITLFVVTAFCATIFATCQVMEFGSAAADRGMLKEFEAIISVVIGGALLTGGYGSVIGATLGALIFGVVQQGLFFCWR